MKKERHKKGFSIQVETKFDWSKCTVYFEEKSDKVVICYIKDSYMDQTFKAKSICHNMDKYSKKIGYELAFDRCLEKRDKAFESFLRQGIESIVSMKNKNKNIEYKFNTFLQNLE
jgi:hypothetical protein